MSEEMKDNVVTMASVLGTEDPEQQLAVVKQLSIAAVSPVIVFTAMLDTRSNKVDLMVSGQFTYDQMYELLDTVRRDLVRQEREALIKQPA